jgi:hypothetical protein
MSTLRKRRPSLGGQLSGMGASTSGPGAAVGPAYQAPLPGSVTDSLSQFRYAVQPSRPSTARHTRPRAPSAPSALDIPHRDGLVSVCARASHHIPTPQHSRADDNQVAVVRETGRAHG